MRAAILTTLIAALLLGGCQTTEVRPTPGVPTLASGRPAPPPPPPSAGGTAATVPGGTPVAVPPEMVVTANRQDHSLSVVDPAAARVLGTIPLDRPPHGVAIATDTRFVFVTDPSEGTRTVAVADVTQGRQVGTIAVGQQPDGIAATAGGQVVVANSGDNTVSLFDATSRTPSAPISVGTTPSGVAFALLGGQATAFVANSGDGSVSVLRLGQSAGVIQVGGQPDAVAPSVDGSRLYVLDSTAGTVAVVDARADQVLGVIRVGDHLTGLATTADGTTLLITADDPAHGLHRMDLATNQVTETFNLNVGALAVVASPRAARAYVTTTDNRLLIWDIAANRVAGSVAVGQRPEGVAVRVQPVPPAGVPSTVPAPSVSPRPSAAAAPAVSPVSATSPVPGPAITPAVSPVGSPTAVANS